MKFNLIPVLALLSVVVVGSNAALPAEVYWHSKWPNTPIPQDLLNLLQPDMEDKCTFWDMGFNHTFDDKRQKYGKHYENAFEEDVNDRKEKYKHYDASFEEDMNDKRKKYGKHYENAFEEDVEDKREKYGKRYDKHYGNAFEEDVEDKREKYGKRYDKHYGNAFVEAVDDKREKYGKHYENAFEEAVDDKREKYGKRYDKHYGNAFEEDVDDKRKKYGKHYENAFEEDVDDKREKYGKRYDKHYGNAFEEDVDDKRKKYGKHYETAFEEDVDDKREKYGKRYDKRYENAFEEDVDDKRKKYGKHYDNAFEEDVNDKREKYGKRYDKRYENGFEEDVIDKKEKYKRYEMKSHKLRLPNSTVFFLYDDFHAGQKMKLHITKSFNYARFLPRQIADTIPFSNDKLSEIFKRFSIEPESSQGKIIKQTVEDCESPGIKGEDRYCPTSLEALVDFSLKHVGDQAKIIFNEIDEPKRVQEYTILDVKFVGEKHIVCHKQKYPYAVYYCHTLIGTKVYTAPLLGADGTKANAVAVCHSDTSDWHPRHLAFLLLKIKPGDGTVCHFIRSDTLVVISTNEIKGKSSGDNVLLSTA